MTARCNCYRGHNSNSGRCNAHNVEGDYCEDCLKHCFSKEDLEKRLTETTADRDKQIVRAVNSHEAAQRLAEAARYVDYSTPIIEDTWGDDEVFEIRLTAKGIRDLRAALAEWKAVK